MQILRRPIYHPEGVVLTLGNFDGVHRGHAALLSMLTNQAARLNALPMALTFYPPPKAYFLKEAFSFITPFADKCALMLQAGLKEILILRFNKALAELSPEDFIHQYLLPLNLKAIVLGDDFKFGKNRQGNTHTLIESGKQHGFEVFQIGTHTEAEKRISSSRVRELLQSSKFEEANLLLGHTLTVTGHVMHGDKRGRTLGFPTMNIKVIDPLCFHGIFAVTVTGLEDEPVPGVASLGTRPMYYSGKKQLLEVHVFDKNFDAYGKKIKVFFHHKIRDEEMFASETQLIEAIHHDLHKAKFYFGIA